MHRIFSNFAYILLLGMSGMGLLMGKIRPFSMELLPFLPLKNGFWPVILYILPGFQSLGEKLTLDFVFRLVLFSHEDVSLSSICLNVLKTSNSFTC